MSPSRPGPVVAPRCVYRGHHCWLGHPGLTSCPRPVSTWPEATRHRGVPAGVAAPQAIAGEERWVKRSPAQPGAVRTWDSASTRPVPTLRPTAWHRQASLSRPLCSLPGPPRVHPVASGVHPWSLAGAETPGQPLCGPHGPSRMGTRRQLHGAHGPGVGARGSGPRAAVVTACGGHGRVPHVPRAQRRRGRQGAWFGAGELWTGVGVGVGGGGGGRRTGRETQTEE